MNYPLISEYVEAIKAAEDNFEELKHLCPVLDDDGQPVMTSGNFAVVFKMKDEQTGKLHAVKCFLKEQEGRAEAYRQIAEELEYVSSTFLTPIKYLDKELFVDTSNSEESEFPVLLMDWVEGQTLDKYIREHIDDQYELSLLAYQFSRLAMWLQPQPFAHGDLKPDNILVKDDGTLVLVDYDGMYVPAMKGQRARELGSPDFRHPGRTEDVFDEHIDDFSLVSILLSLKSIALQPELLEQYGASDRLLFSANDYRNLSKSQVMDALKTMMQDTELATLYSLLILSSAQKNLSQASFRLLNLNRPKASEYENLSTEVTEEDLVNAWIDEYGVKYSADKKRLLKAPENLSKYSIRKGTKVICNTAFWRSFESDDSSVEIPNSVEVIGVETFKCCIGLDKIYIPDSVLVIGKYAFASCQYLTSVTLSRNLLTIDEYAFYDCIRLPSIIIPNKVEEIGDYAFCCCYNLASIIISKSVKNIGVNLFLRCENLSSIVVESSNRYYDSRDNCNAIIESESDTLVALCPATIIPNSVKVIGACGLIGIKDITNFTIPNNIIEIGDFAFANCQELQEITLPNSVKKIGESAFKDCENLFSITLPESLEVIGNNSFSGCCNLSSIILPFSITTIGEGAFWCCKSISTINFPNRLTRIGDNAFSYSGLTNVTILESVNEINGNPFSFCYELKSIIVDIKNNSYDSRNNCHAIIETKTNCLVSACSNTRIPHSVRKIGRNAFSGCNMTSINIPNSVIEIGDYAFEGCYGISTMVIPDSVSSIGFHLFGMWGQTKLTSITLPNTINSIGSFDYFEGTNSEGVSFKEIMESVSMGVNSFKNVTTIFIPKGTKEKYENMFPYDREKFIEQGESDDYSTEVTKEDLANAWTDEYGVMYSADKRKLLGTSNKEITNYIIIKDARIICDFAFHECSYLESIIIPDSIEKIGYRAFFECSSLLSISIPNNVVSIGNAAFHDCSSLKSLVLPNSMSTLGEEFLSGCYSLESILLPENLKSIGNDAFCGCESLKTIAIPKSVLFIGERAFDGCKCEFVCKSSKYISMGTDLYTDDMLTIIHCSTSIAKFTIPNSVKTIGKYAFADCISLSSVIIPNSVKSIGDRAFIGCESLDYIDIPASVVEIGSCAFGSCYRLKRIIIPDSVKSIGDDTFEGCSSLSSVKFCAYVENIGKNVFQFCSSLKSIIIPKGTMSKFEELLPEYIDKLVEQ